MSIDFTNYFRILRLELLMRQHQEFKEAIFHSPLKIVLGVVLRAVLRPLRNSLRRSEILRATVACRPPQQLQLFTRFNVVLNDRSERNHLLVAAVPPHCTSITLPAIHFKSGNDRIIFVHAFYEREALMIFDRLDEYLDYDVVLTTSVPAIRDSFLERFHCSRALCLEAPNHGRDILPFLLALNSLDLDIYRYFIKIHTKRSGHLSDGGLWFRLNLEFLLGDCTVSNAFFTLLDTERPCLYGVESRPIQDHLENNRYWLEALLGFTPEHAQGQFIPGSMFMGNAVFLQRLKSNRLDMYPMEAEDGQLDGTLAHALERYIGWFAKKEGGECLAIETFLKNRGVA